ncbi:MULTISPECIES: universal stress protein [Ralstonia solanacearum species complex]|uniref:Universal stress protein n=1 Tax=Ralstonia syzygii TaxID=28097 RepID=A0ABX7ZDU9_9RALS|nr:MULTISPECIES: universal stress protein [Ralstonia solanacearum species complex]BEU71808.1 universal stress protein [Ralstonia pseudosolanacearum]AXV76740.1 universal stress protein UspA [Ralstonia solanacearum]AXV90750.1 universal stress protein UspA [Ralstonia solanacearum]AXW18910.1 universal stress protein UspA [Ralstonia solanacearum]AXW75663.1 universal stress protein UspA [Ralstonia solanacearum]
MYQRILLAVDGSHASELALHQAILVGKASGAEVEALFVADNTDAFFDPIGYDALGAEARVLEYGRETLAQAAAKLESAGVRHTTKLMEKPVSPGQISATIVEEANESNADLIVLGTHGRRGLKHLVMGSVAEGVVHKTNKPVLMVRSETET